jgi:gliding motility-associated-like protein
LNPLFPNAFNPVGDEVNDTLRPVVNNVYRFTMHILYRWGQIIYTYNDIAKDRDGTYNGKKCMVGAYTY